MEVIEEETKERPHGPTVIPHDHPNTEPHEYPAVDSHPDANVITVMLIDADVANREAVRGLLRLTRRLRVVAEASAEAEVIDRIEATAPHVVVIDLELPGADSLAMAHQIHQRYPDIGIVAVTSKPRPDLVFEVMRAGASGLILKGCCKELLYYGIASVASGGLTVDSALLKTNLTYLASVMQGDSEDAFDDLTEAEIEVLRLLADGNSNREIGEALYLAEITVKKHVQMIMAKLHASDRTHAAVKAYRCGLLR